MTLKKLLTYLLLQTFMIVAVEGYAAADANLSLVPSGGNVFVLQGANLKNLAALDFEFSYDQLNLKNPKAVRGEMTPQDAIFDFNPTVPGEIRLFIRIGRKPVNGSGTIATFSFEGIDNAEGLIRSMSANLVSVSATPVIARVQILGRPQQQTPQPQQPPTQESAQIPPPAVREQTTQIVQYNPAQTIQSGSKSPMNNSSVSATASAATSLGAVTLPADHPAKEAEAAQAATSRAESQPPSRQAAAVPAQQGAPPEAAITAPSKPFKSVTYKSVLERMKERAGAGTPQSLTALFNPEPGQIVQQEPAILIADGESIVALRVELPLSLKDTPSFSLRKASMVSLHQNDDGSWLIQARPHKNSMEAHLSVNCDGGTVLFPLVVAPPIDPALVNRYNLPESALAGYLKSKETGPEGRLDLNGDGKIDYVDDYIFTANFLAGQKDSKLKATTQKLP
ncbi:MAG: hypothetical protein GJV46_13470 [Geobacter sp.]|nr:hypothetical protein [Geobacter sp.]